MQSGTDPHDDYATAAYDAATGQSLWVERYDGTARLEDFASSIAASPDGTTVFVTGESVGVAGTTRSYDYLTIAYDASTGAARWVRRYNDLVNGDDFGASVVASPDGSMVFVTGGSGSATSATTT